MRPLPAILALLLCAIPTAAQASCGPSGLTLSTTGGRLGDPFSLTLSGTPSVSGLLAFDLAPGPVATPIGQVCLGLTPAVQLGAFTLDAGGSFGVTGVLPADPALSGLSVFMQAAAVDATQPSGFALSNGAHPVLRPPRAFFIDSGVANSPQLPSIGGTWVAYDALSDTYGPVVALPGVVVDAVAVPALGWIAMTLSNGLLVAFDGATGAPTLTLLVTAIQNSYLRLGVDGTTLVVLDYSSVAPSPTLHIYPLGAPPISVAVPVVGYLLTPGNGVAYLSSTSTDVVLPFLLSTGASLPPISLNGGGVSAVSDWIYQSGIIYCLLGMGPTAPAFGINAINTASNSTFYPAALPSPVPFAFGFNPFLRFGPGTSGPAIFVHGPSFTTLSEISPQTLGVIGTPITIPSDIASFEPSNGGTEWLMVSCPGCVAGGCLPCQQTLSTLSPTTHAVTTIGPIPTGNSSTLGVVPSASVNKAFSSTWSGVVRFDTDPTTSIVPVTLPISSSLAFYSLRLVVD